MTKSGKHSGELGERLLRGFKILASGSGCERDAAWRDVREAAWLLSGEYRARFSDQLVEEAKDWLIDQVLLGRFRGDSPGEAYVFARRVIHNKCVDAVRARKREKSKQQKLIDMAEKPESGRGSALGGEAWSICLEDMEAVERLFARIRLRAGRKRPRIEVFISYIAESDEEPLESPTTVEEKRARDRVYKDRSMGKLYFVQIFGALVGEGQVSEAEQAVGEKIVSGRSGSARLVSKGQGEVSGSAQEGTVDGGGEDYP